MVLRNSAPLMTALALCMAIPSAYAQVPVQDSQAIIAAQQAVQEAYDQLLQDQQAGNPTAIATDQSNLTTARTNLQNTIQAARTANLNSPEGRAILKARQDVLDAYQRLLQDQLVGNTTAVVSDRQALNTAKGNLQAARVKDNTDSGNIFTNLWHRFHGNNVNPTTTAMTAGTAPVLTPNGFTRDTTSNTNGSPVLNSSGFITNSTTANSIPATGLPAAPLTGVPGTPPVASVPMAPIPVAPIPTAPIVTAPAAPTTTAPAPMTTAPVAPSGKAPVIAPPLAVPATPNTTTGTTTGTTTAPASSSHK